MRNTLEKTVVIHPSPLLVGSDVTEIRIQAGHTKIKQNIFTKLLRII